MTKTLLSASLKHFKEEKRRKPTSIAYILSSRNHKEEPRKDHGSIVIEIGKHMEAYGKVYIFYLYTQKIVGIRQLFIHFGFDARSMYLT